VGRLIAVIFLTSLLISGHAAAGSPALRCDHAIATLQNSEFDLEIGPVHLQDRKACVHANETDPRCEWDVELTRAEQWGADHRFLLAVLNADHRGSGAWDYVFLYRCDRDDYVPAFSERYLYGAKVELGKSADLWITAGLWSTKDPTCCPSRTRRVHLVWRGREKRFVVTESQVTANKARQ
jgi:hypothetical protein